jgi:hypothetical protein
VHPARRADDRHHPDHREDDDAEVGTITSPSERPFGNKDR